MATTDDLISVLRRQGVTSGGDLARLLEVSPATLSRLVGAAGNQVFRIGRTRGARYALTNALSDVGSQLPLWAIDEAGSPHPFGTLTILHGPAYWLEFASRQPGRLFDGLPPFIADMTPQGYLGRAFPTRYPELGLPNRIFDWSDVHRLRAVALRSEDTVGNLVAGTASLDRFLSATTVATHIADYPAITRDLARQTAGSSAAGEYPKFTAYDGGQHLLVKFTSGDGSAADSRWRDLLACEAIASESLIDAGRLAAHSRVRDVGSQRFLEVERFDRTGERGRRAVISLASLDDDRYGMRDNWVAAAERLSRDSLLNRADVERIRFFEAFGRLIANSDRHFGNISFHWAFGHGANEVLTLAPAYDMLPMAFAPATGGMVSDLEYTPPTATADVLTQWQPALACARDFWQRVQRDPRISDAFQEIAGRATAKLPPP